MVVDALPRPDLQKLRWTTREQWHVTLRFLGEVEAADDVALSLLEVPTALSAAGVSAPEAVLGPAVAWFTGRRILQVPVSGLEVLADVVAAKTARWGEDDDRVQFSGHLTLARVRGRGRGPVDLAGTPVHAEWKVAEIVLVASTLGAGGAHYRELETVHLS